MKKAENTGRDKKNQLISLYFLNTDEYLYHITSDFFFKKHTHIS